MHKITRYTGTVDREELFNQLERLFRGLPNPGGDADRDHAQAARRAREHVLRAEFEIDVAADHTVRRIFIVDRFRTLVANRKAAGGITGGRLSYEVTYAPVRSTPQIVPPAKAEPLADFVTALQQELVK